MEFADVVMRRRAVRRFVDGGVDHEVIERIARLAQRTPSAGFSQGQRLVGRDRSGRAARGAGSSAGSPSMRPTSGAGSASARRSSSPASSEEIYHRRYREADKVGEDGREIDWPVPYWWVDIGATMQNVMLAAVDAGLGCGFAGPVDGVAPLREALGIPDEFTPIGVMPVGIPLPDTRSPSLKRGWVPFEQFARWDRWE